MDIIHTREVTSALEIRGCALDSDGKIIVVGQTDTNEGSGMTIRYNQDGLLDTTFNGTGCKIENGNADSTNSYIFDACIMIKLSKEYLI